MTSNIKKGGNSNVTTLSAKANSFSGHNLKASPMPEIYLSALTVQVLRKDLLSTTPNLKFLKSCGRQTLSLFHFCRLSPAHIESIICEVKQKSRKIF